MFNWQEKYVKLETSQKTENKTQLWETKQMNYYIFAHPKTVKKQFKIFFPFNISPWAAFKRAACYLCPLDCLS